MRPPHGVGEKPPGNRAVGNSPNKAVPGVLDTDPGNWMAGERFWGATAFECSSKC